MADMLLCGAVVGYDDPARSCGRPCNYYRVLPPTPDDEGDVSSVRLVVAPPPSWFVTQARRYDGEHVTWPGQRCEI